MPRQHAPCSGPELHSGASSLLGTALAICPSPGCSHIPYKTFATYFPSALSFLLLFHPPLPNPACGISQFWLMPAEGCDSVNATAQARRPWGPDHCHTLGLSPFFPFFSPPFFLPPRCAPLQPLVHTRLRQMLVLARQVKSCRQQDHAASSPHTPTRHLHHPQGHSTAKPNAAILSLFPVARISPRSSHTCWPGSLFMLAALRHPAPTPHSTASQRRARVLAHAPACRLSFLQAAILGSRNSPSSECRAFPLPPLRFSFPPFFPFTLRAAVFPSVWEWAVGGSKALTYWGGRAAAGTPMCLRAARGRTRPLLTS